MTDFANMDPREFCRGLMHGDSREHKLGYTAPNAVAAVCRMQGITGENAKGELLDYATGFAAGMRDSVIGDEPVSCTWKLGYYDGQDTDVMVVNPG